MSEEARELFKTLTGNIDFTKEFAPGYVEGLLWQVFKAGYRQGKYEK